LVAEGNKFLVIAYAESGWFFALGAWHYAYLQKQRGR